MNVLQLSGKGGCYISEALKYECFTELRTQTFIYLTNNVYNYIQIVKKYLINQVRRLPLIQNVCH